MPLLRSLLAWRSSLYLDVDERVQFLRYLDRTAGKAAAARELLWPIRVSLYHVKEKVLGRKALFGALEQALGVSDVPALSAEIPRVACVACEPASQVRIAQAFHEVDRQLGGELRLAGGSRHRVPFAANVGERFADFEDHNCFHRLYWTSRLALAHRQGHKDAGRVLLRDLTAWLDIDWSADRRVAFAYTTSERIIVLTETLQFLREAPLEGAEPLIARIKQRIWLDARHLEGHIEHFLVAHNHIVTNARALAHAARLLPECADAPRWMAQAYELWDSMWPQMILPDGSFKEGSSFYLLMNVRSVLDFLQFSAEDQRPVSPEWQTRFRNAVQLAAQLLREDGSLPRFGNISPDHIIEDLRDVISVAGRRGLLGDDHRRTAAASLYADGGWAFLRRGSRKLEIAVHADPRPDPQTHADAGKGSFELWCNGATLIRDPGNSTYALTARRYFRSARAQNVTTLDGIGIGISEEFARMLPKEYLRDTSASLAADGGQITLTSRGWTRAWKDVLWQRRWALPSDSSFVLDEEITGPSQTRELASYLHLGAITVQRQSATEFVIGTSDARMRLQFELPTGVRVDVEPTPFAPEYGVTVTGQTLVVRGAVVIPARWRVHGELLDG